MRDAIAAVPPESLGDYLSIVEDQLLDHATHL
jgi:hypothetical protein